MHLNQPNEPLFSEEEAQPGITNIFNVPYTKPLNKPERIIRNNEPNPRTRKKYWYKTRAFSDSEDQKPTIMIEYRDTKTTLNI